MIQDFTDWLVFDVFGVAKNSELGDSLNFFFYDIIKIFLLLILITHLMSALRYYLPMEKFRNFLTSRKFYGFDYLLAAVFGSLTPFCSCSSIPLFVGFLQARIPIGVTFAFLITSPLVNEVAIVLFASIFGLKVTIMYVIAGILIGVIGGFVLEKLGMEKYLEEFVWKSEGKKFKNKKDLPLKTATKKITKSARKIIKRMAIYIVIGVGIGSIIHGYVPEDFFEKYLEKAGWFGVPLAVILAIPMYSGASGAIPIIETLVDKGVPLGTALAFMMAIVGVSFPEAMILKRVMKTKLLLTFFAVVTIGIILIGYGFNWII